MIFAILTLGSVGLVLSAATYKQIRITYKLYKGTYDWRELSIRGQANNVYLSLAMLFYTVAYWVSLVSVL